MIFTALGLLAVAAGLLIAGIAKSSVALLMTSLLLTIGAGAVLAMVLPAARRLAASTNGEAHVAGNGNGQLMMTQQGQPVVLYVQQAPTATATATEPVIDLRTPPVVGYDEMTAQQVSKLISSGALTDDQLDALREYESAHAARRSVLSKLS